MYTDWERDEERCARDEAYDDRPTRAEIAREEREDADATASWHDFLDRTADEALWAAIDAETTPPIPWKD